MDWASLGFFIFGHAGLFVRALLMYIKSGEKTLSKFDDYVADNSAVFLLGVILYWILAGLWAWTDLFGLFGTAGDFLGILPREVNAWAPVVALFSDVFFFFIANKVGDKLGVDKLGDKVSQYVPKLSKDDTAPKPPTV